MVSFLLSFKLTISFKIFSHALYNLWDIKIKTAPLKKGGPL